MKHLEMRISSTSIGGNVVEEERVEKIVQKELKKVKVFLKILAAIIAATAILNTINVYEYSKAVNKEKAIMQELQKYIK